MSERATSSLPKIQVPQTWVVEKTSSSVDVTTRDDRGQEHTRPFSFVNRVEGSKPPSLGITMLKPGGRTLANVKATGSLKLDGKPHQVTKIQDADVVFAEEGAMNKVKQAAFLDELQKIASKQKVAIDPMTAAGLAASGKILLSNFLGRHGLKIPGVRHLVQEVMGVGYRTARQGKPMMSRPIREALALTTDNNLMNAYEMAHGAGKASKNLGGNVVSDLIRKTGLTQSGMLPKPYARLLANIPTESKGLRKVVDYGFTPLGQVGKDVVQAGKAAVPSLRSAAWKASELSGRLV